MKNRCGFSRYCKQITLTVSLFVIVGKILKTDTDFIKISIDFSIIDETYAENIRISVALTGLHSTKSNRNGTRAKNEKADDVSTFFGNLSFRNR